MLNADYKELKKANTKSPLHFFYDATCGYRSFFVCEIFMGLFLNLMELGGTVYSAKLLGYFSSISIKDFDWNKAMSYVLVILAVFCLSHIIRFIRENANERARQLIAWRSEIFALDYISKHSSAYLKEQKAGALAQRIIALGDNIWKQSLLFTRAFSCSWRVIIPLVYIGMQNIVFMFIVIIFGIISMIFSFIVSQKSTELNKRSEEKNSQFSGALADSLSNILLIKMFGQEKSEKFKIERKIKVVSNFLNKTYLSEKLIYAWQNLFLLVFRISCIFIGLYLCNAKKMDIENIIVILLLLDNLLPIFERILWEATNFRNNLGKIADSIKILQIPHCVVEKNSAKNLNVKNGNVEFKNVSFAYEEGKNIFKNFNLVINAGEKVGIVGKSGGGKSTLISLLQRNYDVNEGKITIDGKDISKVKIGSLKRAISVISQDNILFHRPIKKNISYGKLNATMEEIIEASKIAQADKFINDAPYGYNTITGERGIKLSGGQRQRIAIARAILKNAPILILDEATSALDNKTEVEVIDALNMLMKNKTIIAIAHRLSTLKNMDRIIVIDKGKIVEEGTPSKLLDKKGVFAKLWKLQK
ncbi:MAG: ABC transporter ATP-binding protein [Alphaproteobacteria bacterium]|nr:ABC transporter ATP-binding protein [Alphaproteobacteria bacterium]